jgi:hypothetical protein
MVGCHGRRVYPRHLRAPRVDVLLVSVARPWPVRSVLAGASGTAVLTIAYIAERRVRHTSRPVDYDDSHVPGQIVASILHISRPSEEEELGLGYTLRGAYGSGFGLLHGLLRRRLTEPAATLAFGGTLITMTLTMFPLLGHTPPPWRWPRGYLATCLATHAAYAVTVAVVDAQLS